MDKLEGQSEVTGGWALQEVTEATVTTASGWTQAQHSRKASVSPSVKWEPEVAGPWFPLST